MSKVEIYANSLGVYVSKCGRVFREMKYSERGNRQVRYKFININCERHDVHRLVASQFIKNPNNKPLVLHYDDNPLNNNVENLRWGTPQENSNDARRNGRIHGSTKGRFKMKQDRRDYIVERVLAGYRIKDIAIHLGISQSRVSQLISDFKTRGLLP